MHILYSASSVSPSLRFLSLPLLFSLPPLLACTWTLSNRAGSFFLRVETIVEWCVHLRHIVYISPHHSSISLFLTLTFCQGQGDSSDDEEGSDSESDTRSYEHQQHAATRMSVSTVALCASCGGAGCGACVQLNCGWQETVRGHAIVRSLCGRRVPWMFHARGKQRQQP